MNPNSSTSPTTSTTTGSNSNCYIYPMVQSSTTTAATGTAATEGGDTRSAATSAAAAAAATTTSSNNLRGSMNISMLHAHTTMDDSLLDFSELDSYSDFLHQQRHVALGGPNGPRTNTTAAIATAAAVEDEFDPDLVVDEDDMDDLTNSDQWSSISNLIMTSTTNTTNTTGTTNTTATNSNLHSILEPPSEESNHSDDNGGGGGGRYGAEADPNSMMMHYSLPSSSSSSQLPVAGQQRSEQLGSSTTPSSSSMRMMLLTHQQQEHQQQQQQPSVAASSLLDQIQTLQQQQQPEPPPPQNHSFFRNNDSALTGFQFQNHTGGGNDYINDNTKNSNTMTNNNNNDFNILPVTFTTQPPTTTTTTTSVYTASTIPVQQPNSNDVLLGRGGKNNQWSGNELLRELARNMSTIYSAAPKRNKPAIAMLLVQKLRALSPPGRFLKQESASAGIGSFWIEVDEEVAREKASQCLRDIVAAMTKVMMNDGSSNNIDGGGGNMRKIKSSKSTTSLRNVSSVGAGGFRNFNHNSTTNFGAAVNATFGTPHPALVSSASTSTLLDPNSQYHNHLRSSVASFFDQHRNNSNTNNQATRKNEALLVNRGGAKKSAAQSGLELLRATPSHSSTTNGATSGVLSLSSSSAALHNAATMPIATAFSTPIAIQNASTKGTIMESTNASSTHGGNAVGNFEWNASSNDNQHGNDISSHHLNTLSSMIRTQQERRAVPSFNDTTGSSTNVSQSVAVLAGLALLQQGGMVNNSSTGSSNVASSALANNNLSRVVSNMYPSNTSMTNQQQQEHLPQANSFLMDDNTIGIASSSAMQISTNNLRDMNQLQQQQQSNVANHTNYNSLLSTQQQPPPRQTSKRNSISASAPNLGDISSFLAKRRRPMNNEQWTSVNDGGSNVSSQNASFAINNNTYTNGNQNLGNTLEPIQLDGLEQRHSNNYEASIGQMGGRASSMIALGANTSRGGNTNYNVSGNNNDYYNNASNDQLLQRFHELRSQMMATTSAAAESTGQNNETTRRLSCVREQHESTMPSVNFYWNSNTGSTGGNASTTGGSAMDQPLWSNVPASGSNNNGPVSRSNNMFASLLQQPRIMNAMPTAASTTTPVSTNQLAPANATIRSTANDNNFDCFTGMGDAIGGSDDMALQRWIDHLAEEELS